MPDFNPTEADLDRKLTDTERLLRRLSQLTRLMQKVALGTFGTALFALVTLFIELSLRERAMHFSDAAENFTMFKVLTIGISLLGFCAITLFELLRRQGDVLFEELSNELQWGSKLPSTANKPRIGQRIVLRDFVQASDLLLVPGRFGPAIYGLVFLSLALGAFLINAPVR
jgi:hypothetical protein